MLSRTRSGGFALPTVVISSVVLIGVLVTVISMMGSIKASLDAQYYNQLAQEAAESGIEFASSCLQNNNMSAGWDVSGKYLAPNMDCNGNAVADQTAYVVQTPRFRTYFRVERPTTKEGSQNIKATGVLEMLRISDNSVWKTYTYSLGFQTGAFNPVNNVVFGYADNEVFFTTIDQFGNVRSVGGNSNGRLGNGTTNNALTPVQYGISTSGVAAYANFVSQGYALFVVDQNGDVWGSGNNSYGFLGSPSAPLSSVSTPVKFQLPAGVKAKSVISGTATFVVASDNNVYSAGQCTDGLLGTSYTPLSSCANSSTPLRVNLPTVVASNPNTIPTTEMTLDRRTAYIIMQGGAVYGWGENHNGQLAQNNYTYTSTPTKIGGFGDTGNSKAVKLAYNGETVYILDDAGDVYAAGMSIHGETGSRTIQMRFISIGNKCLDQRNGSNVADGVSVSLQNCNNGNTQKWIINSDKTVSNVSTPGKCLDNTNGDNLNVQMYNCAPSNPNQQWKVRNVNGTFAEIERNSATNCLHNINADGLTIKLGTCALNGYQYISMNNTTLVKIPFPTKVAQITTDQHFVSARLIDGTVYSVGRNIEGELGNGQMSVPYQADPVKFVTGTSSPAIDVHSTSNVYFNSSNLFVVTGDGKVWGAGNNVFGQLGNGSTVYAVGTPAQMQILGDNSSSMAKYVKSGNGTTIVYTTSGRVYTVGSNNSGQLGDGTTVNKTTPILGKFTNILNTTTRY